MTSLESFAPVDLEGYFGRIGYDGGRSPTLVTLRALHLLHPQAIAFENLDPMLGRPVRLDLDALQRKLLGQGRGGYCYEQNLLFCAVLRKLGFAVTGLCARVVWNAAPGQVRARTHMLLKIDLDGEVWMADVGFGALTLTAPLRLHDGQPQRTDHEAFRVVTHHAGYRLEALVRDQWKPLYEFDLQAQLQTDYEMANWYVSHHPDSQFIRELMVARVGSDCRYGLRGRAWSEHRPDGSVQRREVSDAATLRALLEQTFLIRLGELPGLQALLERVVAPGPAAG